MTEEDAEDIASEALLVVLVRGTAHTRACIDALRSLYGYGRNRKRFAYHRRVRRAETPDKLVSRSDGDLDLLAADGLAEVLALGSPLWVSDALKLVARGATLREAAEGCGRSYQTLYSHLHR